MHTSRSYQRGSIFLSCSHHILLFGYPPVLLLHIQNKIIIKGPKSINRLSDIKNTFITKGQRCSLISGWIISAEYMYLLGGKNLSSGPVFAVSDSCSVLSNYSFA